jgi:adenosylmethionine-8-amino-7-oxononanoate aminotransferase
LSALTDSDSQFIWHPYTQMQDAAHRCIVKGEGALLYDEDGRSYLDAVSSWWTNIHGHAHPHIAAKIAQQAATLEHVIFAGFTHPPAIELAARLVKHLPSNQQKIFFSDNGSTAVEVALKMAVQFWKNKGERRTKIVAFRNAYHGDTFGAMSIGERGIFTIAFAEMLFDVIFIEAPVPGREEHSINELKSTIKIHGESIAAFIFEPLIQGAAGMIMHDPEAMDDLLSICKENEILTVADEVMTGFGRTGKFFACDYLKHQPDIMCLSKGLTGGFLPMAITTCTLEIFNAFLSGKNHRVNKTFYHGHSYTANLIGCAAALASLDLMEMEDTWKNIRRIVSSHGEFTKKMTGQKTLTDVRQCGTVLAVELKTAEGASYLSNVRDSIYAFFLKRGIIMRPLGNVMYLMPPYCMTGNELNYIYHSMEEFLS